MLCEVVEFLGGEVVVVYYCFFEGCVYVGVGGGEVFDGFM